MGLITGLQPLLQCQTFVLLFTLPGRCSQRHLIETFGLQAGLLLQLPPVAPVLNRPDHHGNATKQRDQGQTRNE
ncbi:hypothetical protein C4K37_1523 [Pseudomonas chlororaphis subsp. piscium]|uniref:Secreted protein n=1 Tax=Pseudomonas chlororaphis TaxID=587753 RepID=A0AAX3G1D6_9PSED|nr:hypothetical protein C4K37_1523 [Pseudomonas chlororaphis subsp. piscium]AZC42470.1 hypothetical protein C4K36_1530 [Pseudomonas chlororaphis subsp. piscium]VEF76846.1 Uncharacterised protein [Pseudomonas chlororaphis]